MQTRESLFRLIDDAQNLCGSGYALSKRTGISTGALAEMRAGKRPIGPETVALLADVLELPGVEAQRLAALAVIANPKNQGKAEVLRRAFFGCLAGGIAVACGITTTPADAHETKASRLGLDTFNIVARRLGALVLRWGAAWAGLKRPRTRSPDWWPADMLMA